MNKRQKLMIVLIWIVVLIFFAWTRYWYYDMEQDIIDYISQQTIIREIEQEPEYITVFVEREVDTDKYVELRLGVDNIEQNPELPTGCEVTSLTIVLNYLGYDVDKLTLADLFLPKGEIGETHPDEAFIGNPRDKSSYGANAPVLVTTANDYLAKAEGKHTAYDITGTEFPELIKYINDGYPVMVWETMHMLESYPSTKWKLDSGEYQWYARFHCMVLIGYTNDKYIMADPLNNGITYYDKDIVEQRYSELGQQAIVIY